MLLNRLWTVKIPLLSPSGCRICWSLARGWLANLSELAWSDHPGMCPMRWTVAGLVNVYPRCRPAPPPIHHRHADPPGHSADLLAQLGEAAS